MAVRSSNRHRPGNRKRPHRGTDRRERRHQRRGGVLQRMDRAFLAFTSIGNEENKGDHKENDQECSSS